MEKLTHIDDDGNARMVDVGAKDDQLRIAIACGHILLEEQTRNLIAENNMKKGDVLTVAEIAGIQGGKKTSDLIPLCHQLNLTRLQVKARLDESGVYVESEARCIGKTGVEMEALTAVNVALLTVYDMCKAVDKNMTIDYVKLQEKTKTNI
jgi:cyclic pyranopterin phosphate synthase